MTTEPKQPLRTLFCLGINQNFFDAPGEEAMQVWHGFSAMIAALSKMQGVVVLGTLDDDRSMVGPSLAYPWTAYIMADMPDLEAVHAACNLFRTTPVGDGTFKLWKYCRVEARIGRAIVIPQ